jgi:predicted lipid carrier protein YhbT
MKRFSLPHPFGRLLSLMPSFPASMAFASVANLTIADRFPDDVRLALTGRLLRFTVSDAKVSFDVVWTRNGFVPAWSGGEPDLEIAASLQDFYLLAQRREDPDTLFFSRRLVMEGDTELGLLLKNTLDAMDLNPYELAQALPRGLVAAAFSRLKRFL